MSAKALQYRDDNEIRGVSRLKLNVNVPPALPSSGARDIALALNKAENLILKLVQSHRQTLRTMNV